MKSSRRAPTDTSPRARLAHLAAAAGCRVRLACRRAATAREAEMVTVQMTAARAAPALVSGYWAVLEDQHKSKVRAGENAGQTLRHDPVVRLYKPLPPRSAASGRRAQLSVSRGVAEHPRRVAFVVTDAATKRPLQALALAC